ncbi:hypothetical protein HPB49_012316 [Dermacentor silvarum]|uniref:Uncharacterized protein n=1 Tax=Dermacentor silvarum TaxID=543639 RepID=A0ACB8DCV4_DERSI|nr:hypothetical protein HPB49_012316 [Dermacentor silvarum]
MVAAALAPQRSWYTACSIRNAETVTAAEEVAIALALTDPITKVVISDSQQAIRNYDAGRISRPASHILHSTPPSSSTSRLLLWAPAHESLSGNVQVHTLARDLSCRAECGIHRPDSPDTTISHDSLLTTYTDILQYYRLGRCIYPAARRDLTRREAVQWRKLQTGSFHTPSYTTKQTPQNRGSPSCVPPSRHTNAGSSSVRWRPRNAKGSPPTSSKPAQPVLGLRLSSLVSEAERNTELLFSDVYAERVAVEARAPVRRLFRALRSRLGLSEGVSEGSAELAREDGEDDPVDAFFGELFPLVYFHTVNPRLADFSDDYKVLPQGCAGKTQTLR